MTLTGDVDLELLLRRIIREEAAHAGGNLPDGRAQTIDGRYSRDAS